MEKCGIDGEVIDDNMVHAHCMLDVQGYKHTLGICNNYCFSPLTLPPPVYVPTFPSSRLAIPLIRMLIIIAFCTIGRDSVVGIAIRCWLDGPVIESR